ncbi:MAG: LytTR family transcriptional regulator [Bacteroidales bacterium]|nr:LytTR family transcriptional regulator [Bacteroidales bacterium]
MFDLQKPIPAYLLEKRNIVTLILFTAAFALIFINVYAPFGVDVWFNVTRWTLLLYSSIITLTGVLVVVISRIIMYHSRHRFTIRLWQYLIWVMAEVFFMGLFYSLYQKLILADVRFLPDIVVVSVQNTALVLLLPYSVLWLYFSWSENKRKLESFGQAQVQESQKGMIHFNDERGILRLSVKIEHLLYLEAADNYIYIHFLDNGLPERHLLRNNLKKLSEELENSPLVRCHRSFMVNSDKVKLIRRGKDGLLLELDLPELLTIPVSNTYVDGVMHAFARD